jgi:succinyl-CoA synthetase alpha subunit
MSIFVDQNTRVLVQGITGREGQFHTRQCLLYGTNIVAGVTPGKGGQRQDGVEVFDTVAEGKSKKNANCSLIFVPPALAADAILEAVAAEMELIVAITEGIPILDMLRIKNFLAAGTSRLLGPNCPGIITPAACKVGIMPAAVHKAGGPIGVVSRSGTLTYEVVHQLTRCGIGQTTCLGIGGDPIVGTDFIDCLAAFENDPATKGIVMVGEIGGNAEEDASMYVKHHVTKPVVGFIAGLTAPTGRRMGHAGAIAGGTDGTARGKIAAMKGAGIHVCEDLGGFGRFCVDVFRQIVTL